MRPAHRAVWVGITAAALVAGVGCGRRAADAADSSSKVVDDTAGILSALTRAGDRSQDLGSAEVRMVTDLGTGQPVAMGGVYTWGDGYAFDVEMDTAAARLQALQDAPKIRALFVDGAYYYDVDPQPTGPLAGKEWMKVDASAMSGDTGAQALAGSAGPVASLSSLQYADNVEELGKETVDGQLTTHYRAVLDGSRTGAFHDAYAGEGSLLDSVTGGADSVTMDVWVGGKELPVRLKQAVGRLTVTMDFVKFGGTAVVKAPPAAQTGDVTETLKEADGH
ncbi:hypothetical protein [Streptomyces soliscabiei]|uniref:hypothetical protein n=1 Tax=Streptomyces soliscabiei TaxID=588897 RepID=UPI0029A489F2|nr:hypothetical protein [Streptomyces sp. NY05-11A]MDX2679586.1 hypothetical protein [Streptomyces sp. NY05-11A]